MKFSCHRRFFHCYKTKKYVRVITFHPVNSSKGKIEEVGAGPSFDL